MSEADVLRVIVTLILVLMVIMAGAWAVRRSGFGRSGNTQAMRTVAMQSLGNRAWVAMIEVEDARLVVGITSQQVTLLHTLPPSPEAAGTGERTETSYSPGATGFASALGRAIRKR